MGGRSTERRLSRRLSSVEFPTPHSEATTGTVFGTEGLRRPRQACWHHFRSGLFAQAAYPLSLKEST